MEQIRNPSPYVIPGLPEDNRPKVWQVKKDMTLVELYGPDKTVGIIMDVVTCHTLVTRYQIMGTGRKRNVVQARHLTMFLCTRYMANEVHLSYIAGLLRGDTSTRDHSSVIIGRDAIIDMLCGRAFGEYVTDTLDRLKDIENNLNQVIDESNRTYWESRQR